MYTNCNGTKRINVFIFEPLKFGTIQNRFQLGYSRHTLAELQSEGQLSSSVKRAYCDIRRFRAPQEGTRSNIFI